MKRLRFELTGCLQGIGFRPTVYRVAQQLRLSGWVKNTGSGVTIVAQGIQVGKFLAQLQQQLPPLATIDNVVITSLPCQDEQEFKIIASSHSPVTTIINPDICICQHCLTELFDHNSRFYRYPFLNCSQCGPRYTIVNNLPYDRQQTSMADFTLCEQCYTNYITVSDRRYHAQPTACATCGPKLSHAITEISTALKQGKIIALKGLGGYQLICDAHNQQAINKLRRRKQRASKPFALMCLNLASAAQWITLTDNDKALLTSWQRPIVLTTKRNHQLPEIIAPGLNQLGVMLPSTALYYLLFHDLLNKPKDFAWLETANKLVLIVTSANVSGEPLIIHDQQAQQQLNSIADIIVNYNREIVTRVDDSVVKSIGNTSAFVRRARSYTPQAIKLAYPVPVTLALGGHLKTTVCITRGNQAFLSQHIGDLDNRKTIAFYHETINHLLDFLAVQPERIACDQHPDFYSSQFANDFNCPIYRVQHHHAHLAAVTAEYHLTQPVLGLALDGYGYAADGEAWGGELMQLEQTQYQHLGQLMPLQLPGGEQAAKEPWRMALSLLHNLAADDVAKTKFHHITNAALVIEQLQAQNNMPKSSSCGRLFDAVSALLGVCDVNNYEGQAAMMLESLVDKPKIIANSWHITSTGLTMLPLLRELIHCTPKMGAELFHGSFAKALADWLYYWAERTQIKQCVLSGGCFLNKILSELLIKHCQQYGLTVYFPRQAPVNDAGIALGQAWLAANQ